MADFSDYLEATAGTMGGDGELDLDEYRAKLLQRLERDALLCLVDCRSSMFALDRSHSSNAAQTAASATASASAQVKVEKTEKSSNSARTARGRSSPSAPRTPATALTADEEGSHAADDSQASSPAPPASAAATTTAFQAAMGCILKLFQEKIISSDKDLLGLVLYNTAEKRNPYDFPGVYVLHPFNLLGADSVQEVEQLMAAGVPDSESYKQFLKEAGHRPPSAPSALSDALWAAQHMFLNVRSPAVKYRRIFVFTDDDEPTDGSAVEYRRCCARARDLYEAGVALEVFGMGRAAVKEEHQSGGTAGAGGTGGTSYASSGSSTTGVALYASLFASLNPGHTGTPGTLEAFSGPTAAVPSGTVPSVSASTSAAGAATEPVCFAKHRFWEPLLRDAPAVADTSSLQTHSLDSDASLASPQHYAGAVYVNRLMEMLDVVRRKVHPQRPFLNCPLQIGLRSDGGALPRMAVSVYVPLMRADPPKTEWLESSTNALIKRRTKLVKRVADDAHADAEAMDEEGGGGDGDGGGGGTDSASLSTSEGIRADATCFTAVVGGHHVYFTAAERAEITQVAAAGADAGLFIVCFKAYADVIQHKHVTERSGFLHANLRQGGPESVRLFTELVRSLRRKGRVAIALYRMRATSKPKLVALIPSPDLSPTAAAAKTASCLQFPVASLAAEGLGFYMLPLPYADDIRPVPRLETTTSVTRGGPVKLEGEDAVKPADVQLAREVVRRLSVGYDITAVPNPTLQLIYQNLQDMALRDLAGSAGVAPSLGRFAVHEADHLADAVLTRARVEDYTLPDEEGMARYAELFHDFNTQVLGTQYEADKYCPQPAQRGAGATAQRRARAASPEDGEDDGAGGVKKGVKKEAGPRARTAATATGVKAEKGGSDDDDDASITALVRLAAQRDAWNSLTVPQLKAYIKETGGGPVTGKKKEELVGMAKALVDSK